MISISKLGDTYGVMTMVALPMKPHMHPYKQDLQSMCLDIVREPYTACATELCTHSKVGGSMRKLMFFRYWGGWQQQERWELFTIALFQPTLVISDNYFNQH